MATSSTVPRRHFVQVPALRFGLKFLLIAILLASLPLARVAWRASAIRAQRRAIEAIEHAGGAVWIQDSETPDA